MILMNMPFFLTGSPPLGRMNCVRSAFCRPAGLLLLAFLGVTRLSAESLPSPAPQDDNRNVGQAGEFLDSTALALLAGKVTPSSVSTTSKSVALSVPTAGTNGSNDGKDSLGGLLETAYPASDEEVIRWKDAEEAGEGDLDPADAELDPLDDGLIAPELTNSSPELPVDNAVPLPSEKSNSPSGT
ncbi:MAG: hypothetical protein WA705_15865 [Candidatus Ozemobacteraceae bacterium]